MELRGCGVSFLLTDKFHFRRIDTQDNSFDDDADDKAIAGVTRLVLTCSSSAK
jgi:hypothetical protein